MVNKGGTILSGASREASLRQRRTRALLLSSALATALAGVVQPGTANAACSAAGFPNATVTCTGLDTNGFALVNPFGSVTVNAGAGATVQSAPFGNALSIDTLSSITSNNTAATFNGFVSGISYGAVGNININNFSGSSTGFLGNGITATSLLGNISVQNFTGSASGLQNGIELNAPAGNIDISGFGGRATGTSGDGIAASSLAGNIKADNFVAGTGAGPYIAGGVNGLNLQTLIGNVSVQNFGSYALGGQNGISAATDVGNINLSGFTGTAEGTANAGILARTTTGNIIANKFGAGAVVTGGVNGLDLEATTSGNINVNDFAGKATGTSGAGVRAVTADGDINVKNFSGSATGGAQGLFLTTENGDLNVTNFSGNATGTGPMGTGIYGSADGVINFTTSGAAAVSGGLIGAEFLQLGDAVNVNLKGTTQLTGGSIGLLVHSDYAATGDVNVGVGPNVTVSGADDAGILIDKTSIGGNVTVNNHGTVTSTNGVGIGVTSVIDGATTTDITSSGTVTGGNGGINASTTSEFDSATSKIFTTGPVSGGAGTAIAGYAFATSGGSDATSTVKQSGIISNSLNGIDALASAGNVATTDVLVDNSITVSGFGVRAIGIGDSGSVTVKSTKDGVIDAGTYGILARAQGDDFTVNVETNATIKAGTQGVIAGIDGDNGTVTVTNNAAITSGGSGIIAYNTGGDTTVNVEDKISASGLFGAAAFAGGTGNATLNVNAVIDPPIIGGAAFTVGSGTAQANVNANVQALGVGIFAGNVGTGAVDVNINAGGTIQSNGIGVATFKLGDSGATTIDVDAAIGGLSGTATGGDGILAVAIGTTPSSVTPVTINTTANGTINAGDDGISVFHLSGGNVDVTTNAAITAGDEGIQVLSGTFSTSNVTVTNNAAINAVDNGIFILKGGNGDVAVNANANITSTTANGIEANALLGTGNVTVTQAAATTITANDFGIIATKAGLPFPGTGADGDVKVTTGEGSAINAGFGGIVALKLFGDSTSGDAVVVETGKNSTILTQGVGIAAGQAFGDGNVSVTTGEGSAIGSFAAPTALGIVAGKLAGDGNLTVTTGLNSTLYAALNGITTVHAGGTGDNTVTTGENSLLSAGNDGINVSSLFTHGATTVTTGTNSLVQAINDGIEVSKFGGTGDVTVTVGSTAAVLAAHNGIEASNRAFGAGDVYVNLLGGTAIKPTVVSANNDAIHAGGWDNVTVTTGSYAQIIGDADKSGVGNGIRIWDADNAKVDIGTNNLVSGSGQNWANAVISVRSDDTTTINVGADSLVSSWAYAFDGDLVTAASQIVIDTDGGATTINNYGTIVGRVGLTGKDDVFNNFSSNTWITVGNNYFGGGYDQVNNPGRIVTALQGGVAETTSFNSLELFNNGDFSYVGAGLLDLRDEAPGQIAWNGQRDVTYVSGVFNGTGNSTVGLDTFVGAAGSTSDILQVGGLDKDGNAIAGLVTQGQTALLIHDVNTGPGAFNLAGIKVVDVVDPAGVTYGKNTVGETPSFVISSASTNYSAKFGGVIDKGLFFYDLVAIGNDQYLIGLPDQEVFELSKLVTGAQSIWHETTGVWLDRQADLRTYLQGTPTTLVTKEGVKTINGAPASVTPGIWGKVVGSWGSRDSTDSYGAYGRAFSFDTGYNQNIYGFMAGADFGKEGVWSPNDAVLFGVLGGYLTSDLSFSSSPSSADYSGGTVGVYATYINANWYLDALFKADILSLDYNAPTLVGQGYFGQSTDATNLGFVIDTGYRFYHWGATGFVDGLATVSYVNTNISNLTFVPGTLVDFGNNDSLRAGVGARVGAQAYDAATYRVEASLTGRLWYEFLGDNAVTIFNPGVPFSTVDNFDGLFGEVGVGVNVFAKDSGWNGFVNGDVKFGDSYVAGSAKGGVRYQW